MTFTTFLYFLTPSPFSPQNLCTVFGEFGVFLTPPLSVRTSYVEAPESESGRPEGQATLPTYYTICWP